MKAIIAVIVMFLTVSANAATRSIVPRANAEGGIGTSAKHWAALYVDTSTIQGAAYIGTQLYNGQISTISANGSVTAVSLNVVGATTLDSTLDVDGNVIEGAANYRSTFTASSGALNLTGAVTSLAGFTGTTATFSGDVKRGAENYTSTFTATTGAEVMTGAFTSNTSIGVPATGMVFVGLRTIAELMAATAVAGQIGICSNCSPVEVFISTAAGAPNTGGYSNAVGLQLD